MTGRLYEFNPNILVTGANGFIGQAFCKALVQRRFPFIAVSRSDSNMDSYITIGDINGLTDWTQVLAGIDIVVHLAAYVHVPTSSQSPELIQEVNVEGTANLARQAAQAGVKRLVFVSSIKVNGEYTEVQPFTENDSPCPMDAYGKSKFKAEKALWDISRETGMEIVVVRPPLVYGPRVKANFLSLVRLIEKGLWMPLGAIKNKRSLIYVENLVDALILCAAHPHAAGETFLVSDGPAVSTPELMRAIAKALGRPYRIFSFPPLIMRLFARLMNKSSQMDKLLQSLEIDSSKIRSHLGWDPPFSMQQGLQEAARWFKENQQEKIK